MNILAFRRAIKPGAALSLWLCVLLCSCRTVHPAAAPVQPAVPMASIDHDTARKLDPAVLALAQAAQRKDPVAIARIAQEQKVTLEHGLLRVRVTADKTESVPALESLVKQGGGQITTKLGVSLFALMPPEQVLRLAADSHVWSITLPGPVATPFQP